VLRWFTVTCTPSPPAAGSAPLYRALAPRLRDAGHQVVLITQHTSHPLVLNGIRVYTLPRTDDLNTHRQVVDQTLVALHPDVVESSSWEAETLHYARRLAADRAPVVVRGDLSATTMRAFAHLITAERDLVHAAEAVLAVSEFAATDLAAAYRIPRPTVVGKGGEDPRIPRRGSCSTRASRDCHTRSSVHCPAETRYRY
jgi:hypothetical protein